MKYYSPIGTWEERISKPPFSGWWDATGFGRSTASAYVASQNAYHTGADLNSPSGIDAGLPVYASANGAVVYAGACSGWQGLMVVVKHPGGAWTRYAHMRNLAVQVGVSVTSQTRLGEITDYTPLNSAAGDHFHFDVSVIDLGKTPCDWPKMDIARLERDYRDPKQWILNSEEDTGMWTPTDTVNGTRVRFTPDLAADNILGVIEGGKVVDGTVSADGKWLEVKATPEIVKIGDVTLKQSAAKTFKAYAAAQFMKPAAPPTSKNAIGVHPALPALSFNKRTGVHTLERIEEAREAWGLGCRAFTMMNNISGAREIRQMGGAVIVRHYMPGGQLWSVDQFLAAYGLGRDDKFIVMGINEADNISTSEIEQRFAFDKDFALKVHAQNPSCFVVIGSFSMGTPQLDDPNTAARFKNTYGAFLNANASWCGINYHSYHRRHSPKVPPTSEPVESPDWWPKRFIKWGYDPAYGGLNSNVICVSDEAGVDIGGLGGFPACGYDDNSFAYWHEMQKEWFSGLDQVYIQNIFQLSPRADWAGYNARCVLGGLTKVWNT